MIDVRAGNTAMTAREDQQDALLLSQVENHELAAFESLYKRYHCRLSRFVISILGRSDLADEIINDAMYVVWNKAASYNRRCKPSTWIFGIAYNKARKHFTATELAPLCLQEGDGGIESSGGQWLEQLEAEDLCTSILESLSPEHRTVVELTYFYGMHYREISEIMECPESTVKTRMFYARKHLAKRL